MKNKIKSNLHTSDWADTLKGKKLYRLDYLHFTKNSALKLTECTTLCNLIH